MTEDWRRCPPADAVAYRDAGYWAGVGLGALLRNLAERHGPRTALVEGDRRWTYAALDAAADLARDRFAGAGVRQGDRVVVQLPNCAEFLPLWFGLVRLGAVPVHAMPGHRRAEIGHLARVSGAAAYVISGGPNRFAYRALADAVCAALDPSPVVLVVGGDGRPVPAPGGAARFVSWSELVPDDVGSTSAAASRPPAEPDGLDPSGLALLLVSGGTTGLPKLVPRTHDDYLYAARGGASVCGFGEDTVYLAALPIGFNFTFGAPGVVGTLAVGGTVVVARDPSPASVFQLIERERVTVTALTPPLVPYWLEEYDHSGPDLSSLRLLQVGGARLADDLARRAETTLGTTVQQVYGMAEGLVNYTRPDDPPHLRRTTQGRPMSAGDEVLVVDPDDRPVPDGDVGELLTRGPCTLRGYYRADAPAAFTPDGFYRTGDLVRRHPTGHLTVVGRVKDQINRGGEKISAVEVEEHLRDHPQVRDVALVGVPHPHWGECAVAFLSCDGEPPTPRELAAHLAGRGLAAYKAPERVEVVDTLPLTPVGKVDKLALARSLLT